MRAYSPLQYVLLGLIGLSPVTPSIAQTDLLDCQWATPLSQLTTTDPNNTEFDIQADEVLINDQSQLVVEGNVTLTHLDRLLNTDRLTYERSTGQVKAEGTVTYMTQGAMISGGRAEIDGREGTGKFYFAKAILPDIPARAEAQQISNPNANTLVLSDVAYTGCPEDQNDWVLKAEQLTLYQDEGYGLGRNVWLKFFRVPILYTPIISFPTSDARRSGLLTPEFGSDDRSGVNIGVPFYWNIAPNYDWILTPRHLSKRGPKLDTRFRFLTPRHRGILETEFIPDDARTGESRDFIRLAHRSRWGDMFSLNTNITHLSDNDYLEDLGGSLVDASPIHINRTLDFNADTTNWQARLRLQDFLTLDRNLTTEERPYERMPQLTFSGEWAIPNTLLNYGIDQEWVRFNRSESVNGTRYDVAPYLNANLQRPGWHWDSTLRWHHTYYGLDNESDQSRTLPVFSTQAGLNFSRQLKNNSDVEQTFNPQIQYAHIPYRDQNDLPVFDTSRPDFNFVQLFNPMRFTGIDRIGDTDQVSVLLNTEYTRNNRSLLSATVGQAFYLSDQSVRLPDNTATLSNRSELLGLIRLPLSASWQGSYEHRWDPDEKETNKSVVQLQYQKDSEHLVNLGYRFRRNEIEQTDLSFTWGLGQNWNIIGRWNYSLRDQSTLERFAGLEYSDCCWTLRLIGRKFVSDNEGNTEDAFFAQLELNGLLSVGAKVSQFLERGILGYENN